MAAVIGDDAAKGIDVGGGEGGAVVAEGRPGIPRGAEEAAGDAVARGGEQPFDAVEGTGESGVGDGAGDGGGSQNEGGCFLFLGGGVFGGADDAGAEGKHFVGEAGVDRAGSESVDIEGLVAIFVRDGFDEADEGGLGDAVGREIDAGFRRAAAGEADDLGAGGKCGAIEEEGREGAEGEVSAVEIGADRGTPFQRVGGEGGSDFALKAGGADDAVELRPSGGVGGRGGGDSGVVGDVAAGVAKRWIQSGEIGLVGAGEAPDVVTTGKEAYGEGAADAGAGAG